MSKWVVLGVLVLLVFLAFLGYHSYDAKRAGVTGDVYRADGTTSAKDEARATGDRSSEGETVVYPVAAPAQASVQSSAQAVAAATDQGGQVSQPQVSQSMQPPPATAPGSDTISPNPPNGMVFSGSGRYQLYRQGNITWRLDTETGRSCIIFATDEEWKKPKVYRAGCGRN
ncbi:hypothetical protein [Edaphobacter bradus]|uniref:hypothetical protein n=1 Tax=Edaphobacter bradus TaxID=2259016 RepID=UPI0021E08FCD|nr:hypothetical protein [Edaphobacter bradus]